MPRTRQRPKPQQDEGLKLDDAHAIAILEKAIEYEVIDEDAVPENKRARIQAAAEQIDLLIEAWNNGINPDAKDKEKAEMGTAVQEVLDLAGVEIDEEGNVTYGDLPELDGEDDDDSDDDDADPDEDDDNEGGEDGDEAAFDIDDVIEGYADMSAAGRVKAIKALELDMDDDDDYNNAVGIYEWEDAQEKPSSRVMNFLQEMMPDDEGQQQEEGDEDDTDQDDDEDAEDAGDGDGEESGEWEQPWTKSDGAPSDYDKMSAVDVKKYLDKLLAKDELSADMLQYVKDYEEQREKPPTRTRVTKYVDKLMEQFDGEGGEQEEEEQEDEAPARSGRPSAASRQRSGRSLRNVGKQEQEEEQDDDDDEQDTDGKQVFIVTGDDEGDQPYTAYGYFQAAGIVADLLMQGIGNVTVEAG